MQRYRYYTETKGKMRYSDIEHKPWELGEVEVDIEENSLFQANGFSEPETEPVMYYCPSMDTTASENRVWGDES